MTAKKSKSNKWLYIIGGATVLLVAGLFVAKSAGLIGKEKATEVSIGAAKKVEIIEKVSASGKIQPEVEIKIAPDVPGEITELYIREGDSVQQGQLLLKIRPENYQSALDRTTAALNTQKATLSQQKSALEQAKARFLQTKTAFERTKKLHSQKMLSDADLETAQTNFAVAESDLKAAEQRIEAARYSVLSSEASVKEASTNLSLTSIFAPMNGIVSKLAIEKGERVVGTVQMQGTEMLRIANLNNMEVIVDVNENDIIKINLGDTAIIEVDAYTFNNQKFKGIVTSIANSAKATAGGSLDAVTEFEVKIRILRESYQNLVKTGSPSPFRPGMTANVDIITERKTGILAVPLASVTTRNGKENEGKGENEPKEVSEDAPKENAPKAEVEEVVFVNDNGKAKMVKVKTGISDFENIEILSGLKEGDQVITAPFLAISKLLKDGSLIQENNKKEDKKEK